MPSNVTTEKTVIGGCEGEWLRPIGQDNQGILLYLHGGAYVTGSIKSHRRLAALLAKASGSEVLIINYRLAPEFPFPAGLDDAMSVYSALCEANPGKKIAIAGDSAGGGLSVALALSIRDQGKLPPAALVLLSPWTDLSLSNPTYQSKASVDPFFPDKSALVNAVTAYAGTNNTQHPLISPQYADLGALPATLIHVGDFEALLDDSSVLYEGMVSHGTKAAIKVYPAMWHVWQAFGGLFPEADQSISEIGDFLKTQIR